MTRKDRFRLILAVGAVLQVVWVTGAAAQPGFAWSRATVGLLSDGTPLGEERAQALREAGLDAVVWPGHPDGGSGWSAMTDMARKAGLRILLSLEGDPGADSTLGLALRARKSGFDGIMALSGSRDGLTDDSDLFLVVAGDGTFERIGSLPAESEALDALFARRARSVEKPEAAVLAVPGDDPSAHWLLLPGPVAVPESRVADAAWQTVARFRSRHPALADGVHGKLSDSPYAFFRGMRLGKGEEDVVLVVLGAEGRLRLNVSSIYPDDVVVRDAVSGAMALVSFGQLSLPASKEGIMLLEIVE